MSNLLFGIFPYIALTVMILGSIVRYETDPFSWKSKSSQMLRKKQFVLGSVLFHKVVIVIFFGHLFGLLVPLPIYSWLGIRHETKQVMAMTVGGIAGVMAIIGGLILLQRRLSDPRIRALSSFGDHFVLVILVIQLVLGLGTIIVSLNHLSGDEMVKLMRWAQSIVYFQSNPAAHLEGVNV